MLFWLIFAFLLIVLLAGNRLAGRRLHASQYAGLAIFVFVLIFRFDIGYDYPAYYEMTSYSMADAQMERIEPFSAAISQLAKACKFPPLIFIVFGLLTCTLVFDTFAKYSDSLLLAMLTYMAFFFDSPFSIIRQGMALAVILYGYRYLTEEKWIKYIICCIVATGFHYSAIMCLLMPILYKFMSSAWRLVPVFVCIYLSYAIVLKGIAEELEMYESIIGNYEELSGGSILRYVNIAFLLILDVLAMVKHGNDRYRRFIRIGLIGMMFPFILGGHVGGRISSYFLIYICIAAPNIIMQYRKPMRAVWVSGLAMLFLLTIYISTGNPSKSPYTPYRTIFTANLETPMFK